MDRPRTRPRRGGSHVSTNNRRRRQSERQLCRYARDLRSRGLVDVTTYYTRKRIITVLEPNTVISDVFNFDGFVPRTLGPFVFPARPVSTTTQQLQLQAQNDPR